MKHQLHRTTRTAGDFISENAVRRALERHDDAPERTGRARRLRRWSVAELLARGVPRPPTGGVAR